MKLSDRANAIHGSATVELNARVLALKKSGVDIIKTYISGSCDVNDKTLSTVNRSFKKRT